MANKGLRIGRRGFLAGAASLGAMASLGLSSRSYAQEIHMPEPVVPIEPGTTFRWLDTGDSKKPFFTTFFELYAKDRGITASYDGLPWNEIDNIVPLGVRNGTAHDVFVLPQSVTGAQAVAEGWVMPFDDLIPDFETWKAAFPEGAFVEGLNVFNGRAYGLPFTGDRRNSAMTLFNRPYLQEAGYDPESAPLTWDIFRESARKVTEQGKGQYYGLIVGGNQANRWRNLAESLSQMAGLAQGILFQCGIDYRTGQVVYDNDAYEAAVELLLALRDDGSVFPGTMSINAPQARSMMAQGLSGYILQGPWNVTQWEIEAPDFDFGVAPTPAPSAETKGYTSTASVAAISGTMYIYANSKNPAVAADVFAYLGSMEGQIDLGNWWGVSSPPVFPEAIERSQLSARSKATQAIMNDTVRVAPDPFVRNPEMGAVASAFVAPSQNIATTIQGLFTGQLTGVRENLRLCRDATEKAFDDAFAKAKAQGANVSRDDLVFPNWDPSKDYTEADYAAL